MEFFGEFSWIKAVELLPVYVGGFGSIALLAATFWQVKTAKEEASKRAAFDYFYHEGTDEETIDLYAAINSLRIECVDGKELIKRVAEDSAAHRHVIVYLERLDLLAAGILNKGINEKFSKSYLGEGLVEKWEFFEPLLTSMREQHKRNDIGHNLQELADKWSRNKKE